MKHGEERVTLGIILLAALFCTVVMVLFEVYFIPEIPPPAIQAANPVEYSQKVTQALESFSVNLNTADRNALEELPGIGEALATRILEHRAQQGSFSSVEELLEVKGIGETTLERLRPYVFVK